MVETVESPDRRVKLIFDADRARALDEYLDVAWERVAFQFAECLPDSGGRHWRVVEDFFLDDEIDYAHSAYGIELADHVRPAVIKAAHDGGFAIVEAHSHGRAWPPIFSTLDIEGLDGIGPHMAWRLPDRPYVALVFAGGQVDALEFGERGHVDVPSVIQFGQLALHPTGLSYTKRVGLLGGPHGGSDTGYRPGAAGQPSLDVAVGDSRGPASVGAQVPGPGLAGPPEAGLRARVRTVLARVRRWLS